MPTNSGSSNSNGFIANIKETANTMIRTFALPLFRPTDMGSFGRIICTALIAISYVYYWRVKSDVPVTLLTVLQTMLAYMFGTKIADKYTDYTNAKLNITATAGISASVTPPAPTPAVPVPAPTPILTPVPGKAADDAVSVSEDEKGA